MTSRMTKVLGSLCVAIVASLVASFVSPPLRNFWSNIFVSSVPAWEANAITGPGGKCVDVLGNDNGGNGATVDLWDCQSQASDQRWQRNADGSLETLGRCLDITGNSTLPGTAVQLWDCDGAGGQQWIPRNGTLYNRQSNLCLDDTNDSTANGAALQTWKCDSTPAERFTVHGGMPSGNVIAGPGGKCVDVLGNDNGGNGATVDLWDCQAEASDQHWYRNPDRTLETLGRCLAVNGNGTAPGTTVHLRNCDDSTGQQWTAQSNGTLVNPQSGLCLDDASNTYDSGTPLQIRSCDGSPDEQFTLG